MLKEQEGVNPNLLTPTIKIKWSCKSSIYEAIIISGKKSSTKYLIAFFKLYHLL